jgi:hypothetical protein
MVNNSVETSPSGCIEVVEKSWLALWRLACRVRLGRGFAEQGGECFLLENSGRSLRLQHINIRWNVNDRLGIPSVHYLELNWFRNRLLRFVQKSRETRGIGGAERRVYNKIKTRSVCEEIVASLTIQVTKLLPRHTYNPVSSSHAQVVNSA